MTVTVAVVSWNTRELLQDCLRSLQRDHESGRADVWVFDNASTDESPAMVREQFPWVSLIESTENVGFGPAVNAVAQRTDSEWIVPANADVAVAPDALHSLVACGDRDPRAGVIAPRLVLLDGSTQHSVHSFPTVRAALLLNASVERWSPRLADRLCVIGSWRDDRRRRVDWAHGAFLLVRRESFDAVGGFDNEQWMYAEDLDLCWRLARSGWHTRYEPVAEVAHAVSAATALAWGEGRSLRSAVATYDWIRRRRGPIAAFVIHAINVLGARVRAAGASLSRESEGSRKLRERMLWHARLHRAGFVGSQAPK